MTKQHFLGWTSQCTCAVISACLRIQREQEQVLRTREQCKHWMNLNHFPRIGIR